MKDVTFDSVLALAAPRPDRIIAYGDAPEQFGELWLPEGAAPPALVIFVHGGCWLNVYDAGHSRPLAAAMRDAGMAVWSLEYRRLGDPGGGWPGTFDDVAAGIDHVAHLVKDGLAFERVVLMGHSAGGHLALWASARPSFTVAHPFYSPGIQPVAGVVGMAPIIDLAEFARGDNDCQRAALALLGGDPGAVERRAQWVSPRALKLPSGSVMLQGSHDTVVPLLTAQDCPAGLRLKTLAAGHFDFIHPGTDAFAKVLDAVRCCLDQSAGLTKVQS